MCVAASPAIVAANGGTIMLHILAAVAMLAGPPGPVVEARIADVIADPERYGGRMLRIRGQVDSCYGYVCSICPEDMTPATADGDKCLRMSFDDFESLEDDRADDVGYWRSASRLLEEGFRFSVVTAEGLFDPSCLPTPRHNNLEEVVICTDRGTTFRDVRLSRVHRRLTSNHGLDFSRRGVLAPAPEDVAVPVEVSFRSLERIFDPEPRWRPMAVLQPEDADYPEHGKEAWACVCRVDDCGGRWPQRKISVLARTVNDPYLCYVALKVEGSWRVFPE